MRPLQAATAAGSRNPNTAASAQRPAAAHAAPSTAFALDRPRPVHLALSSLPSDLFKPRPRLEAEILILRHQLNVLRQRTPRRRLHLRWIDRALFIWLY